MSIWPTETAELDAKSGGHVDLQRPATKAAGAAVETDPPACSCFHPQTISLRNRRWCNSRCHSMCRSRNTDRRNRSHCRRTVGSCTRGSRCKGHHCWKRRKQKRWKQTAQLPIGKFSSSD